MDLVVAWSGALYRQGLVESLSGYHGGSSLALAMRADSLKHDDLPARRVMQGRCVPERTRQQGKRLSQWRKRTLDR